ncbi:hypothetical protein OQA88_5870 [Cercophora sp. LCS_1]
MATPVDESSDLLYDMASECEDLFDSCLIGSRSHKPELDTVTELIIEHQYTFAAWAANLGVFARKSRSLDRKLERYPDIADVVARLLDILRSNLSLCTYCFKSNTYSPPTPPPTCISATLHTATEYRSVRARAFSNWPSVSQLLKLDASQDAEQASSAGESSHGHKSELRNVALTAIEATLPRLKSISSTIRQASRGRIEIKAQKHATDVKLNLDSFADATRVIAQMLYPGAHFLLRKRLAEAMADTYASIVRHVDEDLRPYICLSEKCPDGHPAFASFEKWIHHMKNHCGKWHRSVFLTPSWACPVCDDSDQIYRSPEALQAHLAQRHCAMFAPDQLQAVSRQSQMERQRPSDECLLCCLPIEELGPDIQASSQKRQKEQLGHEANKTLRTRLAMRHPGSHRKVEGDVEDSDVPQIATEPQQPTMNRTEKMARHIAGHLQTLMLLTMRLASLQKEQSDEEDDAESDLVDMGDEILKASQFAGTRRSRSPDDIGTQDVSGDADMPLADMILDDTPQIPDTADAEGDFDNLDIKTLAEYRNLLPENDVFLQGVVQSGAFQASVVARSSQLHHLSQYSIRSEEGSDLEGQHIARVAWTIEPMDYSALSAGEFVRRIREHLEPTSSSDFYRSKGYFLPWTVLHKVLSTTTVLRLLRYLNSRVNAPLAEAELDALANRIAPPLHTPGGTGGQFRRTFATLILVGREGLIFAFVNAGLNDAALLELRFEGPKPEMQFESLFRDWRAREIKGFMSYRWELWPMFFAAKREPDPNQGKEVGPAGGNSQTIYFEPMLYQVRSTEEVLPFQRVNGNVVFGGFATTRFFKLHKDQQDLPRFTRNGSDNLIAVKTLSNEARDEEGQLAAYTNEVYLMQRSASILSPHIARLLATIEMPKAISGREWSVYHLIFEAADRSIGELWKSREWWMKRDVSDLHLAKWMLLQCYGVTHALWKVHELAEDDQDMNEKTRGPQCLITPDNLPHYQNWDPKAAPDPLGTVDEKLGVVQLSDFGLSVCYLEESANNRRVLRDLMAYDAPETKILSTYSPAAEQATYLCTHEKSSDFVRELCHIAVNYLLVVQVTIQEPKPVKYSREPPAAADRLTSRALTEILKRMTTMANDYFTPSKADVIPFDHPCWKRLSLEFEDPRFEFNYPGPMRR